MYEKMYGNMPVFCEIAKFLKRMSPNGTFIKEIAYSLNPANLLSFNATTYDIDFSGCAIELCMAFNITLIDIHTFEKYYKTHNVKLESKEMKRLRITKRLNKLTPLQVDIAEGLLKSTIMSTRFHGDYREVRSMVHKQINCVTWAL
jgi:hypothetical protein